MQTTDIKPIIGTPEVLQLIKPFTRADWPWIRKHPKFPAPLRHANGGRAIYSSEQVIDWLQYIAKNPNEIVRTIGGE